MGLWLLWARFQLSLWGSVSVVTLGARFQSSLWGLGFSRYFVPPKKSVTPRKLHNPAKELQRPGTKDMQYAYKELPLGNRAFALRMLHLEKKKQKQLEKEFKRMQK
uniref:39S ribosomal protein L52, mitochondrial n=1 Tax=Loa loa TaxID=7209 RepID=A0A1I7VCH8_LOALO